MTSPGAFLCGGDGIGYTRSKYFFAVVSSTLDLARISKAALRFAAFCFARS
jgi:hypothetical protein